FGLSGSESIRAGVRIGLHTASEAFADRAYRPDGSLTARSSPDALVEDERLSAEQAVRMVTEGKVRTVEGTDIPIRAD
ncbi:LamB/YcsF family protein, partial [Acinetobacter baumannii]